jgi:hypothetical protein
LESLTRELAQRVDVFGDELALTVEVEQGDVAAVVKPQPHYDEAWNAFWK